jgi:hypothetical protein
MWCDVMCRDPSCSVPGEGEVAKAAICEPSSIRPSGDGLTGTLETMDTRDKLEPGHH